MYNHLCKIFPHLPQIIQDDGKDCDYVVGITASKPGAFTLIRTAFQNSCCSEHCTQEPKNPYTREYAHTGLPHRHSPHIVLIMMTNDISGTEDQILCNCRSGNNTWRVTAHIPVALARTREQSTCCSPESRWFSRTSLVTSEVDTNWSPFSSSKIFTMRNHEGDTFAQFCAKVSHPG